MAEDRTSTARGSCLYLVDASPYVFRAYHALPESIVDPSGRPVQAAYGFADFLVRILGRPDLTHVAIAFDESLTTCFRNELYPPYKAQRPLPPPELEAQLADCQALAAAFGAVTLVSERYESDDLIATAVTVGRDAMDRIVVVSPDKDLAQLVDEKVVVFDFARDRWLDRDGVKALLGVAPAQVPDFLALQGDPVDNIPGVPGVGPKTARALLETFESLDEVYERIEEVEDLPLRGARGVARKLAAGEDLARTSLELARLACDAPLDPALLERPWAGADPTAVDALLARLGFQGVRRRIPRWRS